MICDMLSSVVARGCVVCVFCDVGEGVLYVMCCVVVWEWVGSDRASQPIDRGGGYLLVLLVTDPPLQTGVHRCPPSTHRPP